MMQEREGLPANGRPWRAVERELQARELEQPAPRQGFGDRYWPTYRSDVYLGSREAWNIFAYANVWALPRLDGLARIERELRSMIGDVLHVPEAGAVTLTSGGTESNFLAMKAARALGRRRGIEHQNVVVPATAHPSFDKAGDELGVEVRRAPVTPEHRADPAAMAAAADAGTIMLVASAPCYPQGVVDPIAGVADVAAARDVWMHVDACVGGFLVPFLIELGEPLPEFRFDIAGVWSVSADLHKFGYTLHGMSTLTVRRGELQALHAYHLPEPGWRYRDYSRTGFTGSRPAGSIASAWATLQLLGRDGYLDIADGVRRSARAVRDGVEAIDGLWMLAPPEAGIVVIGTDPGLDPEAIAAGMAARGWDLSTGETPPTIHIMMDPHPEDLTDAFISDLREVTELTAEGQRFDRAVTSYGD
jgi:glutamate/tyrosine decarboxylase-like PLP-dependent enzyme